MIAMLNIFSYKRKEYNDPSIKFHLPDSAIFGNEHSSYEYIRKFKKVLEKYTDFFSSTEGTEHLNGAWEIWSFREKNGEHITIENPIPIVKKVCIFPVLSVEYNPQRVWPNEILNNIIEEYSSKEYHYYKKIIGIDAVNVPLLKDVDIKSFRLSTNFNDNINHILSCSHYIGGDTGLSHFASVLNDEKKLHYYYCKGLHGTWRSEFTAPFHLGLGKGTFHLYEKYDNS